VNRLDKIEHEAREVGKYMEMGGGTDGTGVGDTLALVAVARAAEKDHCQHGRLKRVDKCDVCKALAPLLESTAPRQGNTRDE